MSFIRHWFLRPADRVLGADAWIVEHYHYTESSTELVAVLGVFSTKAIADVYAQSRRVPCHVRRFFVDEPARKLQADLQYEVTRKTEMLATLADVTKEAE